MDKAELRRFRKVVRTYWKKYGRHDLPWRKTRDPYRILVSEMMLQQTQVPRVIEKYKEFLRAFPTVQALARAPLSDVLRVWSGLGYNRRAKYLHETAKLLAGRRLNVENLEQPLPGVGPYTRNAVLVFAFNEPEVLLETNIRSVFIHHFFSSRTEDGRQKYGNVKDAQVLAIAQKAAEGQDPRTWHAALMDYGVYVKKLHQNPSRKSAHYTKQSKFEGSLRQVRGVILRELHRGPSALGGLNFQHSKIRSALAGLVHDGLIRKSTRQWQII